MKQISLLIGGLFFSVAVFAQAASETKSKKGYFYFEGGSHRAWYTHSDIHVQRDANPSFDFTLFDVQAKDEGGLRWHTAPQFSYALGYYFKNKGFGLEYHYDHIKYFVQQGQRVRMEGSINGHLYDQDTTINPAFFMMEHSDGGNLAMVNVVKWFPLAASRKGDLVLNLVAKAGAGVVNPKTNTTIMGNHRDDRYHISGYVTGVETGLRLNLFRYLTASTTFKGFFANYKNFLIAEGRGNHKFFGGMFIYQLGAQFPL